MSGLEPRRGALLTELARASIAEALGGPRAPLPREPWAKQAAATFVTLHRDDGALQGCIGSLQPRRALADDVAQNAVAAALRDPRAAPLSLDEVATLTVEVSLLSPLQPVPTAGGAHDEAAVVAALRPGIDGVVVRWHGMQGTLLPQVWTTVPDRADFLAHVKAKAQLPADFWAPDVEVLRYTLEKWSDPGAPRAPQERR
ncbi:MAG: hypothetical protein NVS3B10_20270 [Polyangiales bacterium]